MVDYKKTSFQIQLIEKAKSSLKTIVLPESHDDRVLQATSYILENKIANIILLGYEEKILARANELEIDLSKAEIVSIEGNSLFDEYVQDFYELRKTKNITLEEAREKISNECYFATMMVYKGQADGLVCGAVHTTADTIIPAFQIIKTSVGTSVISSVFFMVFDEEVLVYADCAVNPNPSVEQLAQIAKSSAQTAEKFSITPKVALLSYSTGSSGKGEDVEKIKQVAKILEEEKVSFDFTGPIQYDAAVDENVAAIKLPEDKVAGQANVMIFPDLTAGNICYKAVQRSANIPAIGPILQGLNKPVNDLSRGATVQDIIDTIIVTAVQAQ